MSDSVTPRISITVVLQEDSGRIACIEVDANQRVDDVKSILETNWGIPMASLTLAFNGRVLSDHERLNDVGITTDGRLFVCHWLMSLIYLCRPNSS